MKPLHYSCEEVGFQTSEKDIHYLYPTQTVWMTLPQGTYVLICFQEQGLKLIQLQGPQWSCSSSPTSRMLSNVFKRVKEETRNIFIFQWKNIKLNTKLCSQVHVEVHFYFTESCAWKCDEKFSLLFYFNTFTSFYLCLLWKLHFFSQLVSYFVSFLWLMTWLWLV